jgi:hypothetical protein
MEIKYIVYNPNTGENVYVNSEDEAKQLFLETVTNFVSQYFHNSPYTIVQVDATGVETTIPSNLTVGDVILKG